MIPRIRIAVVCAVLLGGLEASGQALKPGPFKSGPFKASPQELLAFAGAQEEAAEGVTRDLLLSEAGYRFEADGTYTSVHREIYHCITQEDAQNSSVLQCAWSPWYQDEPQLKARVITPDGKVHSLNQATIEKVRIPSSLQNVFTDQMLLRAPLPAVAVGAIVESTVRIRHRPEVIKSGEFDQFVLGRGTLGMTRKSRLLLDYAPSVEPKFRVVNSDVRPQRSRAGKYERLVFEAENSPSLLDDYEEELPPSVHQFPTIAFSTGSSWEDAATEYARIVEEQLADADLTSQVRPIVSLKLPREKLVASLVRALHERVRYTGIAFGNAAIVPNSPMLTLRRGYGDCKDKSLLLVAMLRAAGIPANVALIRSGPGEDIYPELPALTQFDHAIVHIPGDTPIWIDATADQLEVGQLPYYVQDRYTLVAGANQKLTRTPLGESRDNRIVTTRTYRLKEGVPSELETKTEYFGHLASTYRSAYAQMTRKQIADGMRQQGTELYGASKMNHFDYSSTRVRAPGESFYVEASYKEATLAEVVGADATAVVFPVRILSRLPQALLPDPQVDDMFGSPEPGKKRRHLVRPFPHRSELVFRAIAPVGYVPVDVPQNVALKLGPASLNVTYEQENDHTMVARFVLDTGNRDFSLHDVRETQARLQALGVSNPDSPWRVDLKFEDAAGKMLAEGVHAEGVREYLRRLKLHPDDAMCHARLAMSVAMLGFTDFAQEHARKAVELEPENPMTHRALAAVLEHNPYGRQYGTGMNRPEAISAYRRALELAPDSLETRYRLAGLLQYGDDGSVLHGAALNAAVNEYRLCYKQSPSEMLLDNTFTTLWLSGKLNEAGRLVSTAEASPTRNVLLLAAIAEKKGFQACAQRASQLDRNPQSRDELLVQVSQTLNIFRSYPACLAINRAMSSKYPNLDNLKTNIETFSRLKQYGTYTFPANDPRSVVRDYMVAALYMGPQHPSARKFLLEPNRDDNDWALDEPTLWVVSLRQTLAGMGLDTHRIADSITMMDMKLEGTDERGYHVRLRSKTHEAMQFSVYLVRTESGYRLLSGNPRKQIGKIALQHIERNELQLAREWLNRASTVPGEKVAMFDQFSGDPFRRLWMMGNTKDEDIRVAAAALAADSEVAEQALRILDSSRATLAPLKRLQVDRARLLVFSKLKRHRDLLNLANELRASQPASTGPVLWHLAALERLGDLKSARAMLMKRLEIQPDDLFSLTSLARLDAAEGDYEASRKRLGVIFGMGELPLHQAVDACFLSAMNQQVTPLVFAEATRAITENQFSILPPMTSYAVVSAEQGNFSEATATISLLSERVLNVEQLPLTYYVQGRLAEHCGLSELARKKYQRVQPPKREQLISVHDLAQLRLRQLSSGGGGKGGKSKLPSAGAPNTLRNTTPVAFP